jgi:hypothetical protein
MVRANGSYAGHEKTPLRTHFYLASIAMKVMPDGHHLAVVTSPVMVAMFMKLGADAPLRLMFRYCRPAPVMTLARARDSG